MTKPPYARPSYYYGLPDMYMQMGYFPFPTPPPPAQLSRNSPYAHPLADPFKSYMGQTEKIEASDGEHGFASLVNPLRSSVLLYVNQWLLTNFSPAPLEAHIWFGKASSIGKAKTSSQVTSGYIQLAACPAAQGQIMFGSGSAHGERDGVFASTRIIPPLTTTGAEPHGQWVIGPGMAMVVRVPDAGEKSSFSFCVNWWEQPLYEA
ncbi:DUF6143 family protein [Brevibacillus agri]|uniref:DUF6143 family protein n=1 Tax=Brevibacillus agri TaxID=51101 RepID=UPI003D22511E